MRTITVVVFLSLAALAACYSTPVGQVKYADKDFLSKQKIILDLLKHVHQPEVHTKYYQDVKQYDIEQHYDMYANIEAVKEFVKYYKYGGMLKKGDIFSITNQLHRDWAVSLFHTLYYAKTWDTFYKTMVWASYHLNEGLFVYGLTVAVLHHPDMVGMELPAPYEIYPYYFFNADVIQKAQIHKMQGFTGMKKVEDVYNVVVLSNYTGQYLYTNPEQKVSYFTEDIGLNTYYYYFHMDYPFWMGGKEFNLYKDRRGELYLFEHQQILARYFLERLCNDLGSIPEFDWYTKVKPGYYPNLRYYNGLYFPARDNYYQVYQEQNYYDIMLIEDYERRIRDAIDYGFVILPDGTHIDLTKPEAIDYLGNMIQGNPDMPNHRVYKYLAVYAKLLLGGASYGSYDETKIVPSVLEHFETSMRDPVFYVLYKRLIKYYWQFKEHLKPYKYEEIFYHGVKIQGVEVDKLITYFDKYDADITNAVDIAYEHVEEEQHSTVMTSQYHGSDFVIKARQWRLNHMPFTIKMNVLSEKVAKSVVRVYLGPKYDEFGNLYQINDNRENMYLLDTFLFDLQAGQNSIVRHSKDFAWFVKDRTPYYQLYKWVMSAYKGETQFPLDVTEAHCGFPQRLMLPKGKKSGMPMQLYFIITPYIAPTVEQYSTYDHVISCGVGSGARYVDALPLGYPFDRVIDEGVWFTPNMYYYDTMIFHKKEVEINATY